MDLRLALANGIPNPRAFLIAFLRHCAKGRGDANVIGRLTPNATRQRQVVLAMLLSLMLIIILHREIHRNLENLRLKHPRSREDGRVPTPVFGPTLFFEGI